VSAYRLLAMILYLGISRYPLLLLVGVRYD